MGPLFHKTSSFVRYQSHNYFQSMLEPPADVPRAPVPKWVCVQEWIGIVLLASLTLLLFGAVAYRFCTKEASDPAASDDATRDPEADRSIPDGDEASKENSFNKR